MLYTRILLTLLITLSVFSCVDSEKQTPQRFGLMPSAQTGIDFSNDLHYDEDFNIYTYRNFYNGGGVAVGDVNNDGLIDIYFSANMQPNKLYLNRGDWMFSDETETAGVGGTKGWSTGVTIVDINGDGWLDIYVCNSGDLEGDNKQNELFINQGHSDDSLMVTFVEQAAAYNLADGGYGTHATFFDMDKDGDLDAYLLNNSYRSIFDFNRMKNQRPVRDELGGDKLLRNDNNIFVDISEQAGIYGSEIGFGLGVTVGDINKDGWPDIFVSNDFFEKDYLYINQKNGTFLEDLENQIRSLSVASMGADMADINNDGFSEIFVTEMLPADEARFKTKMTFENWDRYQYNLKNGYYHQFTRNVLQLNNGDGTFSEIGRFAGVEATDWSWGALIADFDNDGLKDLFVANGLYHDIIDQDYINYVSNEEIVKQVVTKEGVNYKKLIDTIPSNPIANYLFKNNDGYSFSDKAEEWGLSTPGFSNGASYADLDNDGDLDIIVNNVNSEAFVYQNYTSQVDTGQHYIKVVLEGSGKNVFSTGAKITVKAQESTFYQEIFPVRGFQSSVDHRVNFGLGKIQMIDTLEVLWPDDRISVKTALTTNQTIILNHKDAISTSLKNNLSKPQQIFTEVTSDLNIDYNHIENLFVDFDRDRLIYHMISTEGPKISVADVNGDELDDFFVGGAANMPGKLFQQNQNGTFSQTNQKVLALDQGAEDLDCIFFDADNDLDLDLYVAHGGNEFVLQSTPLVDQLYLNDGSGTFSRSPQYLPTFKLESSSCVYPADYDADGDQDLFVGIRIKPGFYGTPVSGYLLNNDGTGMLRNLTNSVAPDLQNIGMITDAQWVDVDSDDDLDLVLVGEWMPITVLINENGKFSRSTKAFGSHHTEGWWSCLRSGDFDNDGDIDLVAGNHGLNSRFEASQDKPITLYLKDFDNNGTPEPIVTQYNGNEAYPLVLRHDLVMQLPSLKKKYPHYKDYKEQTIEDVFSKEQLESATVKKAFELRTSYLQNNGDGSFEISPLPHIAQFAPMYAILVEDFDKDGNLDLMLGGNLHEVKPEVGRYDASYGVVLQGAGDNTFLPLDSRQSGFKVVGQIRDLAKINVQGKDMILVAKNNEAIQVFEYE